MDPLSLGLAAAQFGFSALGSFNERDQQRDQVRQANKQIRAQNQFAQQNWQYGEQMRQRQNRQARALYDMKKQQYELQKELDYDAYKEFYEDSQLAFDRLVMQATQKAFQSEAKLAKYQAQAMMSAGNRGVGGRRTNRRSQAAQLASGMEAASRAERLTFEEQQMEKGIKRAARRTDLRIKQAFNMVGPAPEDLPMAPMPVMGQQMKMPGNMGLYAGLGQAAIGAVGTYSSLTAPSTGSPTGGGFNSNNFQYGGSKQSYGGGLDLGGTLGW